MEAEFNFLGMKIEMEIKNVTEKFYFPVLFPASFGEDRIEFDLISSMSNIAIYEVTKASEKYLLNSPYFTKIIEGKIQKEDDLN